MAQRFTGRNEPVPAGSDKIRDDLAELYLNSKRLSIDGQQQPPSASLNLQGKGLFVSHGNADGQDTLTFEPYETPTIGSLGGVSFVDVQQGQIARFDASGTLVNSPENSGPGGGAGATVFEMPIVLSPLLQGRSTWAMPAAVTEYRAENFRRVRVNMAAWKRARLHCNIGSPVGPAGSTLRVQYAKALTPAEADWAYLDGVSGPQVDITGLTVTDKLGTHVALTNDAKAEAWLRVVGVGGDGTTLVSIGPIWLVAELAVQGGGTAGSLIPITAHSVNDALTTRVGAGKSPVVANGTLTHIFVDLGTAPVGQDVILVVKRNGSAIATVTVPAGSDNVTAQPNTPLLQEDNITVDVTQIGTTQPGRDLTVAYKAVAA